MARVTVFCVQPYWRDGDRKLAQGALREFPTEAAALAAARRAAQREAGALVYSVSGDADFEDWEQPRWVAAFGAVPEVMFGGVTIPPLYGEGQAGGARQGGALP